MLDSTSPMDVLQFRGLVLVEVGDQEHRVAQEVNFNSEAVLPPSLPFQILPS
jgi:hypothetical protein